METIVIAQIILCIVFILITIATYFILGAKILTANILLLSLYAVVVPLIFFTFGKFIEGKITENEVSRLLNETLRIYTDFGGVVPGTINIPVDTSADDKAEKNNNQLIKVSLAVLIPFMILGIGMSFLVFIYSKENFKYKRVVMEDFILILIIVAVELAFFSGITYNYRYIDKNKVVVHALEEIKKKVPP